MKARKKTGKRILSFLLVLTTLFGSLAMAGGDLFVYAQNAPVAEQNGEEEKKDPVAQVQSVADGLVYLFPEEGLRVTVYDRPEAKILDGAELKLERIPDYSEESLEFYNKASRLFPLSKNENFEYTPYILSLQIDGEKADAGDVLIRAQLDFTQNPEKIGITSRVVVIDSRGEARILPEEADGDSESEVPDSAFAMGDCPVIGVARVNAVISAPLKAPSAGIASLGSALSEGTRIVTRVSHTPNISDDGVQNGNYSNNANLMDYVTIPGATELCVTIEYGGENTNYDWVCMWAGYHPEYTAASNFSLSLTGKLGGAHGSKTYTVPGDSVTFGFRSDGSGVGDGFGYYAVIEARIDTDFKITPAWHKEAINGGYAVVFDEGGVIYGFIGEEEVLRELGDDKNRVTEIRLHKDITQIGVSAFQGWTSVDLITSPEGSKLSQIRRSAFQGCTNLANVNLSGENLLIDGNAFGGCTKLYSASIRSDGAQIAAYAFEGCTALSDIRLTGDGIRIKNSAFRDLSALTAFSVTGSAVSLESYAFYNCAKLVSVRVGDWDLSAVTDLSYAFYGCASLTELDVSGWNTSALTDIAYLFYACYSLESLDMSTWDLGAVTSMNNAFYMGPRTVVLGERFRFAGASAMDPSYWRSETTGRRYLSTELYDAFNADPAGMAGSYTFDGMAPGGACYALLYTSGELVFQTDSAPEEELRGPLRYAFVVDTSASYATGGGIIDQTSSYSLTCTHPWASYRSSVTTVIFRDRIAPKVMRAWFYGMSNLTLIENMENLDMSGVTEMYYTFANCNNLTALDVRSWKLESLSDLSYVFADNAKLSFVNMDGTDVSHLSAMTASFWKTPKLTSIHTGDMKFENLTTLRYTFFKSEALTELDVSDWDMSKVTSLHWTFNTCGALTKLDVSGWDVQKVTTLEKTFYGCSKLTELNVGAWETSSLSNISNAFYNCKGLTELSVSSWDVQKLTNASYAFYGCSGLTELDVSGWDVQKLTNASYLFYGCSGLTQLEMKNWNTPALTNMSYMFYGCGTLEEMDLSGWNVEKVSNLSYAFANCGSLTQLKLTDWNTAALTNMANAFYYCGALEELNLESFNTAKVTNMDSAFLLSSRKLIFGENFRFAGSAAIDPSFWEHVETGDTYHTAELYSAYNASPSEMAGTYIWYEMAVGGGCYALLYSGGDLVFQQSSGNRDTQGERGELVAVYKVNTSTAYASASLPWYSNRTSVKRAVFSDEILPLKLDYWFYSSGLKSVENMENLNLSGADSMRYTFYSCTGLTELDVSGWDLSSMTDLYCTFYGCSNLVWLDTGHWDLSQVTTMYQTFRGCSKLVSMDASGWGLGNLLNLNQTFYGCAALQILDASGWDLSKATTVNSAFYDCKVLTTLDSGGWGLDSVTDMASVFRGCAALTSLDVRNWNLSKVTTLSYAFYSCSALTGLDVDDWQLDSLTNLSYAFYGCTKLAALNVGGWNMAKVANLSYAFYQCYALKTLDVGSWTLDSLTNLTYAFYSCTGLTSLDVGNWKLSKVTTLARSFYNCSKLLELDVSRWDLSSLTEMPYAFASCSALTRLDVENWNVSKVTNFSYAFSGCKALTELKVGGWKTTEATDLSYMFQNCSGLTELDVKNWNVSKVTSVQRMIYGCTGIRTLDVSGWNTEKANNNTVGDSELREITLGSKVNIGSNNYFDLGGTEARWVEKGLENPVPMTVSELYAQHKARPRVATYYKVRTIVFDPNGGTAVPPYVPDWWPEKEFGALPKASRRGADFDGWWTSRVGGEQLLEGQNPEEDLYFAHWIDHEYTLILDANNGTYDQIRVTLGYNQSYTLSETLFSAPWLVIVGWNTLANGEGTQYGENESVIQLTEEDGGVVYLYAQWASLDSVVYLSFDSQGGTPVATRRFERGDLLGRLPTPVRSGYTFTGWHIESEDGALATERTVINGNMTLVATWEIDRRVTFDFNLSQEEYTEERKVPYNTAVGELPGDVFSGKFGALRGWYTLPEGGEQIDETTLITEDVTFWAHWGWRPRFHAAGGRFLGSSLLEIKDDYLYTIDELPEAEYDGYLFDGWYWYPPDGSDPVRVEVGDTVDLSQNVEIVAHWVRANTVKITLIPNSGSINGSTALIVYEVYKGQPVAELPVPTRSGYEFLGWRDMTGQIEGYCDRNTVFNDNATLMAEWIQQDCKVTFDRDCPDGVFSNLSSTVSAKVINVPTGYTVNSLPGCTRPNYILEGWYTQSDGQGEKLTTDTPITGDVTYYAHWVTFLTTGTSELHEFTYGAEWHQGNNQNADNVGDNLEMHPTDNTAQKAQLRVFFEVNNAYGSTSPLPVGAVSIRIPKHIFFDEAGNPLDSNNIEKFLTVFPEVGSEKFSYVDDPDSDYYILKNNVPLETGGIDFTIVYTVTPNDVAGGATNADGRYVEGYEYFQNQFTVVFEVDEDPQDDSNPVTHAEKDMSVEMHTKIETRAEKYVGSPAFSYLWSNAWGEKPEDADDYFYITWHMKETYLKSTNQPSSFAWNEDNTVHDGTVVWISQSGFSGSHDGDALLGTDNKHNYFGCTVVTKHPVTLLQSIPTTGLTFYNEAIVDETWDSGYVTQHRVSASTTLYSENYLPGEFEKDRYNSQMVVSGGQETILDDEKEISMPWYLVYDGGHPQRPLWDEKTQTYIAPERTIRITDGVYGDVMYSSGRARDKYVWLPETDNIPLNDDDYYFTTLQFSLAEFDAISKDGIWSNKLANSDTSRYSPLLIYVRYRYSDEFVFYESVEYSSSNNTITFPEGVVGFEILYDTTFYWTKLEITAGMKLVPTANVMAMLQGDVNAKATSIIKNVAVCDIWYTEEGEESNYFHATNREKDDDWAQKDLYELNISKTTQKTEKFCADLDKLITDPVTGTQDIPMMITGYNENDSKRNKRMSTGVFYDLLPSGTSVDPSTVMCFSTPGGKAGTYSANNYNVLLTGNDKARLQPALYDIRFVSDWQGSGRTMMIVQLAVPENRASTGFSVFYLLHNTNENIRNHGTNLANDVAFVNTSLGRVWPDDVSGSLRVLPDEDEIFFQDLFWENEGFIGFAMANAVYENPTVTSWGFDKYVNTGEAFKVSDSVLAGNSYTYRLAYGQSASATSWKTVLYDVLEKSARRRDENDNPTDPNVSKWHGTFESIQIVTNFTNPQDSVINPVIYYSTAPRKDFNLEDTVVPGDNPMCDLTDEKIWTTEMPEDKSLITAIAVDFSKDVNGKDFTMRGKATLEVYITMRSPTGDVSDIVDEWAYNEGVIYSRQGESESQTPLYSDAQVQLKDVDPELDKSSDRGMGSKDEPILVKQNERITYTLRIKNPETEVTLYDIVTVDEVPPGLNIRPDNEILVHFGNPAEAVSVNLSPRVTLKREGQKLTFNISSLLPGETMHIEIPVIVTVTKAVFANHAEIPEVNDVVKDIQSDTTYHEVVPSTEATLLVIKELLYRPTLQIQPKEFTFVAKLVEIDGQALPESQQISYEGSTTGANGLAWIGPIDFGAETENHIYLYEITELKGSDERIEYSDAVIYARIHIRDLEPEDEMNVYLVAEIEYLDAAGNSLGDHGAVVNKYLMDGVTHLEIDKRITGDERIVGDGEFHFTAAQADSQTKEPLAGGRVAHGVTVGTEGRVIFEDMAFTQDDVGITYTFRITEDAGDIPGIEYSDEVIYADVTVGIDERNELDFHIVYYVLDEGVPRVLEEPVISNRYEKRKGDLTVSKNVSGVDSETDREFRFAVIFTFGNQPMSGAEIRYEGGSGKADGTVILDENGSASFTLKHGQSLTFKDLPEGASYRVTETDADTDGYVSYVIQTVSGTAGSLERSSSAEGSIPASPSEEAVAFVNVRVYELPGVGGSGTGLYTLLGGAFLLSAGTLAYWNFPGLRLLLRRKKRNED